MNSVHPLNTINRKPIRVGLLMNGFILSYAYFKIIEQLIHSEEAEICVVIINKSKERQKKITLSKLLANFNFILFHIYQLIDRMLFKKNNYVLKTADSKTLLSNIPVIETEPDCDRFFHRIKGSDVDRIKSFEADVLIRMGFRILKGEILKASKYGIWSYHHANNKVNRGGPPCFWEMYENDPVTGTIVQVLSDDLDNGKVIYTSLGATHKYSLNQGRNHIYAKSIGFIPRLIKKLYHEGPSFLETENGFPDFYSKRLYSTPSNSKMIFFLTRLVLKSAFKWLRSLFFKNQWFLMFSISKANNFQKSLRKMKKLNPPSKTFWADPHIVFEKGKYFIFVEEKNFKNKNAHIAVISMDENGNVSKPVTVLKQDYHLSYPFVFLYAGSYYMIPESRSNKSVELYKASSFPHQWEKVKTILQDVEAVDCTLHEHDGKWWMFVNIAAHPAASCNDELHLFYADSPLGNWTPHRSNPVKSDVRNSRPAGRIFKWNQKYYRPSQDCSVTYGYGIRINEIKTLTENNFEETEVDFIEPLWEAAICGVHTFSYENRLTVIDAFRKSMRW